MKYGSDFECSSVVKSKSCSTFFGDFSNASPRQDFILRLLQVRAGDRLTAEQACERKDPQV